MATFDGLFMGLVHTSLIIQSKCYLLELFKDGAQGMCFVTCETTPYLRAYRCLGDRKDLDGNGPSLRRSEAHRELLIKKLDHGPLWQEYGIVDDVVVCTMYTMASESFVYLLLAFHQ